MTEDLLYIPPCCVSSKLPDAITQAHGSLLFYTHSDVGMEHFYRAVSYLVGGPHVLVLAMPVVEPFTMAFLNQCFSRNWISDLVLSTYSDNSDIVDAYLNDYRQHVLYTHSAEVTHLTSHMVIYNDMRSLAITGPMYAFCVKKDIGAYTMIYNKKPNVCPAEHDWGNFLRNILFVDAIRMRKVYRKKAKSLSLSPILQRFLAIDFPPYPMAPSGINNE